MSASGAGSRGDSYDLGARLVLLILLVLVPLALNPFNYVPFEPSKMALLRAGVVLLAGVWLLKILTTGGVSWKRSGLDVPIVALLVVGLLSSLTSISPRTSFYGELYRYDGFLTLLAYAVVFFAVSQFIEGKHVWLYAAALVVSAIPIGLYAVLQRAGLDPLPWDPQMDLARAFSTFGNPVFLGGYLVLVLPLALSFVVNRDAPRGLRVVSAGAFSLGLAGLVFSYTRAAWLGFALGVMIFAGALWLRNRKQPEKRAKAPSPIVGRLVLVLALAATAGLIVAALPSSRRAASDGRTPYSIAGRLSSAAELVGGAGQGSISARLELWKAGLRMAAARPLYGFGLDTFRFAFPRYRPNGWFEKVDEGADPDKAHNQLLGTALSTGFLGLLAYLWVICGAAGLALRWVRSPAATQGHKARSPARTGLSDAPGLWGAANADVGLAALAAALFPYFLQLQSSFMVLSVEPLFWALLGFLVVILRSSVRREEGFEAVEHAGLDDAARGASNMPATLGAERFRALAALALAITVLVLLASAARPVTAENHIKNARAGREAGTWATAAAELERAVALNSGEAKYFLRLGESYYMAAETGQVPTGRERARAALARAIELNPLEKDGYYFMGDLMWDRRQAGSVRLAIPYFKRVVELDPYAPGPRYNLGFAHLAAGDARKAIPQFEMAVDLDPSFAEAYFSLGKAQEAVGRLVDARDSYRRALDVAPDHARARSALEQLGGDR